MPMKVVICCIAYQEDQYVEEWIDYHRKLGFDAIHMWQNKGWECQINRDFLFKYSYLREGSQVNIYNNFMNQFNSQYDWSAFIDCDEFLTLRKHKSVKEFIENYEELRGIGLNWQYYGSMGKETRESNSLLKQFTHRQNGVDKHVKTIMNMKSPSRFLDPHSPNAYIYDTNKIPFQGPFHENGPSDIAALNHYHKQTLEDFKIKVAKGREDGAEKRGGFYWNEQHWHDIKDKDCDVEDTTARDFMYG